MKYEQILNDLKNKIYYPVYVLSGEEPYYIDTISDYIEEHILTDTEKEFNQNVVYGRDTDVLSVISMAKRYPMMANYQVVIVKEAQDIKNIDDLAPYVENPLNSTLLVINYKYKKIDGRKSFAQLVKKKGVFFESKKIYDNQLGPWMKSYLEKRGYSISPKASVMLVEFLGTNLSKIVNELEKLTLNIPEKAEINDAVVEQNIGISKDFNTFELQNAIGSRNVLKANQIANYFAANPKDNPLIKTVFILNSFFGKLLIYHQLADKSRNNVASALSINPFFVKDYQAAARHYSKGKIANIISYLREYDLKSKGVDNVSATDGELLKELLFKILH
ncbi:MAG: DNA polymerase III subunit delta [Bacteroidales bacterium]|nr:DNA polymerase III subunit delta [Bacteroidales bacterium]